MTPFGLRRRTKRALGMEKPEPVEIPRHDVIFLTPDGQETTTSAEQGDTLLLASGRTASPIESGCGDSTCATCRVEILSGADQLAPPKDQELATKRANGVEGNDWRLGCMATIQGPGVQARIVNVFGALP